MSGKKLAITFPGMGYHNDKPLLYYSKRFLKEKEYEIVEVSYIFDLSSRTTLTDSDRMREAFKQAYDQTEQQLAGLDFDSYEDVVFIGKSIGTVVAAKYALEHGLVCENAPKLAQVLYTPVPATFEFLKPGHNLVWHGQADPVCTDEAVLEAQKKLGFALEMIPEANHSLETKDYLRNLGIMQNVINELGMFLHEGNGEVYSSATIRPLKNSSLEGKSVLFLGSSVTYGYASFQDGLPEYFARRFGCCSTKDAISGTTLVDREEISYVNRLKQHGADEGYDMVVCQLSTNDANLRLSLGDIADGTELEAFDTLTITGAIEYIIAYAKKQWNCPVYFYTNAKYENTHYQAMVDRLYELKDKWKIGIFDLWNDSEISSVTAEDRNLYMYDAIHPTKAGYMRLWGPAIERQLND